MVAHSDKGTLVSNVCTDNTKKYAEDVFRYLQFPNFFDVKYVLEVPLRS